MPWLSTQGLALSGMHSMPETAGNPPLAYGFNPSFLEWLPTGGEQDSLLEGFFYMYEWNGGVTDGLMNCALNSDF